MKSIEFCFGKYEVNEILTSLRSEMESTDPTISEWARSALESLQNASPSALLLTLELLKRARRSSLGSCLRTEYALSSQFFVPDCNEFMD